MPRTFYLISLLGVTIRNTAPHLLIDRHKCVYKLEKVNISESHRNKISPPYTVGCEAQSERMPRAKMVFPNGVGLLHSGLPGSVSFSPIYILLLRKPMKSKGFGSNTYIMKHS